MGQNIVNHKFGKGLISIYIYKEPNSLSKKNLYSKMGKGFRYFLKEDIQMWNRHMTRYSTPLISK